MIKLTSSQQWQAVGIEANLVPSMFSVLITGLGQPGTFSTTPQRQAGAGLGVGQVGVPTG